MDVWTRRWFVLLALTLAGDALALSRGMWSEFNALYLMNLRPTAECRQYKARSLELLQDNSLSAEQLDARMRALWGEAKASCLNKPAAAVAPTAKPATAVAAAAPEAGSAKATVTSPPAPMPPPVSAPVSIAPSAPPAPAVQTVVPPAARQVDVPVAGARPVEGANAGAPPGTPKAAEALPPSLPGAQRVPIPSPGDAHAAPAPSRGADGSRKPGAIARPQFKPIIERPSTRELEREAACAKRNPYAYQATEDDPCAKVANKATPEDAAAEAGRGGMSRWLWMGIGLLVTGAAGAGAWFGYRAWAKRRRGNTDEADAEDAGAEDAGGDARPLQAAMVGGRATAAA
jgi:hypothetical protein